MLWIQRIQHLKNNHKFYPDKILDVGACVGHFFDLAKKIWPNSDITMVEANPLLESELKKKSNKYHICVLSNKIEEKIFFTNKLEKVPSGASLYVENSKYYNNDNVIENKIYTTTLNDLFPSESFDLIKLDTQGSELDIIDGGKEIVRKAKYVLIETSVVQYNINAPLIKDVINYLDLMGFSVVDIWNCAYANIVPGHHYDDLCQIDLLFKNNSYE